MRETRRMKANHITTKSAMVIPAANQARKEEARRQGGKEVRGQNGTQAQAAIRFIRNPCPPEIWQRP